jgi:parallel beta-helix repeat protein
MNSCLAAVLLMLVSAAAIAAEPEKVIEVSAEGSIKTLAAARDAARGMKRPVRIEIAGGTYVLTEPVIFDERDSGITVEAKAGETPIFSGGRRIEGWKNASFNGRDCWSADVPQVRDGKWFFRELWIDGQRAVRARHPDKGYLKVKESPDAGSEWEVGQTRFRFDGNDIPAGPFSFGTELIVGTRWVESRLPLRSVDTEQHLASFSRKSQWRMEPNDPYWLEGDSRWLDQAGEWFLDRINGTVYYLPLTGQAIEKVHAVASVLTHLIELRGGKEKGKFLEDITLRGLIFAHTEWMLPEPDPATTQPVSGGFTQAAIPVPAAVQASAIRRCVIEKCTFRNLGTWGLDLGHATQLSRVVGCTFSDLGGGGIRLGDGSIGQGNDEQTFANQIIDNDIAGGGRVFPSAVGIWVGQAFDNVLAHNHIHDFYYSGISAGWSWGYGDSLNRGNVVEQNHIHHIGTPKTGNGPLLADMGGIYLLGARQGTVARNNLIHDINGVRIAWGIYLDEGCSDTIVENNVVYRTSHGGFHQHYGKENIVRNNVFAFARQDQQIQRTREEPHVSFTFERNILAWTGTPMTQTGPTNVKFDRNLYSIAEADFSAGGKNWEQWRAAGEDANSIIGDPMFTDPQAGDFTLKGGSPASKIGFQPIDVTRVGPRK